MLHRITVFTSPSAVQYAHLYTAPLAGNSHKNRKSFDHELFFLQIRFLHEFNRTLADAQRHSISLSLLELLLGYFALASLLFCRSHSLILAKKRIYFFQSKTGCLFGIQN